MYTYNSHQKEKKGYQFDTLYTIVPPFEKEAKYNPTQTLDKSR
jgi:hypothetical protein